MPENKETSSPVRDTSEFGRGWPLIAAASVGFMTVPTTLPVYSLGVLTAPLQHAFGWSRGEIQAAVLFSTGLGVICAPIIGYLISVVGIRRLVLVGLLGMALGFGFAADMSGSLLQFYAAYSIMAVLGAGAGNISWARLIAGAFTKHRGLALGLALSGTGFCALLGPLYTAHLVKEFGWRIAYAGLACVPLLLALPLAIAFIPKARHDTEARVETESASTALSGYTVKEALLSYRFWTLAFSITAVYFAISGLIPNLVPMLTDRGLTTQAAAKVTSILGPSIIVSRMILGWLFDRYWAPLIGVATVLPAAAACIFLNLDLGIYGYMGAAALIGVATGVELDLLSYLLARYFGLFRYARIYGWIYAAFSLSAGLAPMAFGRLYDRTGSYHSTLNIAASLFLVGSLLLLTLGRYPSLPAHGEAASTQA